MVPKQKPGIIAGRSKDSRRSNFTRKLYRFLWVHRKTIMKITLVIIKIIFRSDSEE